MTGRAAVLLEVVIALAVLVTAMGLLGAQLASGLNTTFHAEEQLRASLLADRIVGLVQLDPDMQRRLTEEDEFEDKFGDDVPGYYWRIKTEPVDREHPDELKVVTIQVLYQPDKELQDSTGGIGSATLLRQLGLLKAKPGTINLVEQAGLNEEQAEELRQAIPIPGFDPSAIDLQQLMGMLTTDQITQLLPMLMPLLQQISSGNVPADLANLAQQLGGGLNLDQLGGTSPEDLANMIQQAVGSGGKSGGTAGQPAAGGAAPGRGTKTPPAGGTAGGAPPPAQQPAAGGGVNIGQGSGPNGEYTIEDLMRLRDEYERQQGGGK
jgi:hypothetical protein